MSRLIFYLDTEREIDWEKIRSSLPPSIEIRIEELPFFSLSEKQKEEKANSFAMARIFQDNGIPYIYRAEIEFEMRRFEKQKRPSGILYDGLKIRDIYFKWLYEKADLDESIIILTDDLLCSKGEDNYYHARSAIYSYPCLISLSGLNISLARDRFYYLNRFIGSKIRLSLPQDLELPEEWLDEYLLGLILQSLFFFKVGNPFCERKDCRLFNAHTLKEMIEAQILSKKLCKPHEDLLRSFD